MLASLAVFGPFLKSGSVLLLDYGHYPGGPDPSLPSSTWGFPPEVTTRAPFDALLVGLSQVLGREAPRLLPLLVIPLFTVAGFYRLFDGRPLPVATSSLFFFFNPFVYERLIVGQVFLVLGYASLPLIASIVLDRRWSVVRRAVVTGILLTLAIAVQPHFVFIGGLLVVVIAGAALAMGDRTVGAGALLALLVTAVVGVYWLIPLSGSGGDIGGVTSADLDLFRTASDPTVGLYGNLAGLYGFWRVVEPLPKFGLAGWPLIAVALLLVVAMGAFARARSPKLTVGRPAFIAIGLIAYFLALGDRGPTAPAFRWMFEEVPGFRLMREPQKFAALLALSYAIFYGSGADFVLKLARSKRQAVALGLVVLALPCVYTYRMFWGFNGHVRPSEFPSSWAEADAMMGAGNEKVLALPWHLYMAFPWTQDRVVTNPMDTYFRRDVLSGDNIELGHIFNQSQDPRSAYLEFIYSLDGDVDRFGNLVAPLGVRYILVSKVQDWRSYDWLGDQSDLRLVAEWDNLLLFENDVEAPLVAAPQGGLHLQDWGEVVGLSGRVRLTDFAITVDDEGPGEVREPAPPPDVDTAPAVPVSDRQPVAVRLEREPEEGRLTLAEAFHPEWSYAGGDPSPNMGVTNTFEPGSERGDVIEFGRWERVRTGYVLGGAFFGMLVLVAVLALRRDRSAAARLADVGSEED